MIDQEESVKDIVEEIRKRTDLIGWPELDNFHIEYGEYGGWDGLELLKAYADRIEAAYNRENHCEKRYDKDGDEMPPHCAFDDLKLDRLKGKVQELEAKTGNVAKLREVLEWATSTIDVSPEVRDETEDLENEVVCWVLELQEKAHAALAATPRNCDVGTAVEQAKRFHEFCHAHRTFYTACSDDCPFKTASDINHCQSGWGQLPYDAAQEGGK